MAEESPYGYIDEGYTPEPTEEQLREREEQQKLVDERYRIQQESVIPSREPDPLRHTITVRNPLIPQPAPEINPLVPLLDRPSRSHSTENVVGEHRVEETATGEPGVLTDAPYGERMKRDELNRLAGEVGLDPGEYSTKHDVVEALDKEAKAVSEPQKPVKPEDIPDPAHDKEPELVVKASMPRLALEAIAREHGLDPTYYSSKAKLANAIKKQLSNEPVDPPVDQEVP
jgi:hypothetical protein